VKPELQLALSQTDFDKLTQALKRAFDDHLQWLSDLNYAMVCDHQNLSSFCCCDKPHYLCNFGRWYYSVDNIDICEHIDFINLGIRHKKLHLVVCNLINEFNEHGKPAKSTYLEFKQIEELFLKEIKSFLHSNLAAFRNTDHLTQLPNRHALEMFLERELSRLQRKSYQSCIAMLDIDFFKSINDKYGHSTGDEILKKFADLLTLNIRNFDFVARYGGEEFIIYFPDIDCQTTYMITEKLRKLIQHELFVTSENHVINITCSFGIASFNEGKTIKTSITDADKALYQAKNTGRNKVIINKQPTPCSVNH
jgi:diguanylate cyclase (GGDEF)-like protein